MDVSGHHKYYLIVNYSACALPATNLVSHGHTSFLVLGVIACSISAQPEKGLVNCLYITCSTATIVAAPIKSQYSS